MESVNAFAMEAGSYTHASGAVNAIFDCKSISGCILLDYWAMILVRIDLSHVLHFLSPSVLCKVDSYASLSVCHQTKITRKNSYLKNNVLLSTPNRK